MRQSYEKRAEKDGVADNDEVAALSYVAPGMGENAYTSTYRGTGRALHTRTTNNAVNDVSFFSDLCARDRVNRSDLFYRSGRVKIIQIFRDQNTCYRTNRWSATRSTHSNALVKTLSEYLRWNNTKSIFSYKCGYVTSCFWPKNKDDSGKKLLPAVHDRKY